MDHAVPSGYQYWLLLLLSARPAEGLNTLFFAEIRSQRNTMAQATLMECFVSHLSHLRAAQPQKAQQKSCHYNPFPPFTQIPVREKGGGRGTDTRAGLTALFKPTFWGEKGEPLSSWGDACYPRGDSGAGFLWSPMLPPSIAHQSTKTFQQITWHFVKT